MKPIARLLFLALCWWSVPVSHAQTDTATVPHSDNGWYLSPHDTIRVLVLFCEIEYDQNPGKNPANDAAEHWPKGQLPK